MVEEPPNNLYNDLENGSRVHFSAPISKNCVIVKWLERRLTVDRYSCKLRIT